jgi:hypothetical protein
LNYLWDNVIKQAAFKRVIITTGLRAEVELVEPRFSSKIEPDSF